jgi:microcin C transport system ATP-binding protein
MMLSAPDAPLLDVRNLNVRFRQGGNETIAVDGVSFTLKRGTTLALVGESGSGKSVTALSIVRLLSRAAEVQGQVLFKGEDLLAYREARLREIRGAQITMVFQEPMTSLNPLHTIARQIGEILELHGARGAQKIKDRIIELLQEVGIPDPAASASA